MKITNVKLSVEIDSGNAALVDDPDGCLKYMLTRLADRIIAYGPDRVDYKMVDYNGQRVGKATLEIEREEDDEDL